SGTAVGDVRRSSAVLMAPGGKTPVAAIKVPAGPFPESRSDLVKPCDELGLRPVPRDRPAEGGDLAREGGARRARDARDARRAALLRRGARPGGAAAAGADALPP